MPSTPGGSPPKQVCDPVSIEVLVLGVLSGLRPATSQVAVFALLRAPAAVRSLLAFCIAGLFASFVVGLLVVFAFGGAGSAIGHSTFSSVFTLVAGVASLGFAAGIARNGLPRRGAGSTSGRSSKVAERLRRPSAMTAAAAGVATHIPGLIYLVALNSIASGRPKFTSAAVQVLIYDLLWFAIPLTALTFAFRSPSTAQAYIDGATAFAQRHQDRLLVSLFGALGVYLTLKGTIELA
jgi:hypothetical protein